MLFRLARCALWVCLALLALTRVGHAAWLETRVKAHRAVVAVERDGRATVDHELTLGVRGGPLKTLELPGVDTGAVLDPEATVVPIVRYGVPASIPLVLALGEDGTLRIDIDHPKGLRTGSYLFRFRYSTNLLARDKIRRRGPAAEVEWVGPRFADGVDVAKVVFRLPAGPVPPSLPVPEDGDEAQLLGSAFLSQLRHDGDQVEVELVRPHLARGEPAVWRVLASPKVFDGLPEPSQVRQSRALSPGVAEPPVRRVFGLGFALLGAVAYALAVTLKWGLFRRDCRASRVTAVALLPLPIGVRASLAGALASGAAVLGVGGDYPTLAGVLLVLAVIAASIAAPKLLLNPRAAGHWLLLKDEDAFTGKAVRRAGRFLDFGTLPGALLALLCFGGVALGVAAVFPRSPYHALCLALGSVLLLPLFATGRGAHLPGSRSERARRILPRVARDLRARGLKVHAWARLATGESEPDELRLLVRSARARDGLLAIEVGVEQQATVGGFLLLPFVLIRVREGSAAQRSLGRQCSWQRGRTPEERVALVRPGVPARGLLVDLVAELVLQLTDESRPPTRSSRNSGGTSSFTSKLAPASPAHAT